MVSVQDIGPDAKEDVFLLSHHLDGVVSRLICLRRTLVSVLIAGNLLRGQLGVHVHELKDFGTDFVELLELNFAEHLNVLIALIQLICVVHGLGLTQFVLHGPNHILCDLAIVSCGIKVMVGCLTPLRDERIKVRFALHIGQRIAVQSFILYEWVGRPEE